MTQPRAVTVSGNPVASKLAELAEAGRTGVLHLPGESGGIIGLSAGEVVYAESGRAPALAARLGPAGGAAASPLEQSWIAREATVDAAAELMSARSGRMQFRESAGEPGPAGAAAIAVPALVTEVSRRHAVLRQVAAVLTPDTPVVRNPRLRSRAVHVTDLQWAVLLRLDHAAAPRDLAMELGQSVFGITLEAFRMLAAGVLSPATPAAADGQARPVLSFLRALAG